MWAPWSLRKPQGSPSSPIASLTGYKLLLKCSTKLDILCQAGIMLMLMLTLIENLQNFPLVQSLQTVDLFPIFHRVSFMKYRVNLTRGNCFKTWRFLTPEEMYITIEITKEIFIIIAMIELYPWYIIKHKKPMYQICTKHICQIASLHTHMHAHTILAIVISEWWL